MSSGQVPCRPDSYEKRSAHCLTAFHEADKRCRSFVFYRGSNPENPEEEAVNEMNITMHVSARDNYEKTGRCGGFGQI